MAGETQQELATVLRALERDLSKASITFIGQKIEAVGVPGGGSVTGMTVHVTAGAGASGGTVIGNSVSVVSTDSDMARTQKADLQKELVDAAALVEKGDAPKSMIKGLLDRLSGLAAAGFNAATVEAAKHLADQALS